jgi:steroid delta-isomerase-like uncharacterized protein
MAEANLTGLYHRSVEAINSNNMAHLKDILAPDAVFENVATKRVIRGADQIIQAIQNWKKAAPDAKGEVLTVSGSGSTVTAEIRWQGTHTGDLEVLGGPIKATGHPIQMRTALVATTENGKLKQVRHFFDQASLLQEVGEPVVLRGKPVA